MIDLNDVLKVHEENTGILEINSLVHVESSKNLAEVYTPGVAELSKLLQQNPAARKKYTMSGKLVALISDGTAVLGLGNMSPVGSLPITEGKSLLYKELAGVNAVPLCIEQAGIESIVETIKNISQSFAGIHLEDISAPNCFAVEERLQQELDIPVYHDDQEGTAIVVLAGLINAAKVVGKDLQALKIVINGVGASGVATARLFSALGMKNVTLIDIKGKVTADRPEYNKYQKDLTKSFRQAEGNTLDEVIVGQDVFIGLSDAYVLSGEQVSKMADQAIIFALANPVPEILPEEATKAGAAVVATGSNQWPNQVNNILAFPGLFQGLLKTNLKSITSELQYEIAKALSSLISEPKRDEIIPNVFDEGVVETVSAAVKEFAASNSKIE